jgi:hypothetical protein
VKPTRRKKLKKAKDVAGNVGKKGLEAAALAVLYGLIEVMRGGGGQKPS